VALEDGWIAVGAPQPGQFARAGSVHLFRRSEGDWQHGVTLQAPDAQPGDAFGTSVAMNEGRLVVGAPGASDGEGTRTGAAYVFRLEEGTWAGPETVPVPDMSEGASFGTRVDLSGLDLVVSAPTARVQGVHSGAVHVYRFVEPERRAADGGMGRDGPDGGEDAGSERDAATGRDGGPASEAGWSRRLRLHPDAPASGLRFGEGLAVSDRQVLVGVPGASADAGRQGEALVYVLGCSSNGDCSDGDPCTRDICDPVRRVCSSEPVERPCPAESDAGMDGEGDAQSPEGSAPNDAAMAMGDAGADAGTVSYETGCAAAGPVSSTSAPWVLLVLVFWRLRSAFKR
jgi:hypothetical protein